MKLHQLIECAECSEVDVPTTNGRCPTCGSIALAWVSQLSDGIQALPAAREMTGIDKEFLREMGVSA